MSQTPSPSAPDPLTPDQIEESLIGSLSPLARLALSYAPRAHRLRTLALLALDARLANLLRHSKEPMLAQLRISWWRETIGQDASAWPSGEPLLAALRSWDGEHGQILPLVDGWEALTAPAPLAGENLLAMAQGRAGAFAGLAQVAGCPQHAEAARAIGLSWGLTDLAVHLRNAQEQAAVVDLIDAQPVPARTRVPRPLRSLKVLETLSHRRFAKGRDEAGQSPGAVLEALRVGLLGR